MRESARAGAGTAGIQPGIGNGDVWKPESSLCSPLSAPARVASFPVG
jgi:hypothetical protein